MLDHPTILPRIIHCIDYTDYSQVRLASKPCFYLFIVYVKYIIEKVNKNLHIYFYYHFMKMILFDIFLVFKGASQAAAVLASHSGRVCHPAARLPVSGPQGAPVRGSVPQVSDRTTGYTSTRFSASG